MQIANLAELTYDYAGREEGLRSGRARLAKRFGARATGATVYELPPGEAASSYHYEFTDEEWLVVLEGAPSVRAPEGTTELRPGDVAFFPSGEAGAHQLRNDSDETARVIMWSPTPAIQATHYLDEDEIAVWDWAANAGIVAQGTRVIPLDDGDDA